MKILLIVPSYPKISGVAYHRLWIPHNVIGVMNKDYVSIELCNEIDTKTYDELKRFDFVVANRFISQRGETRQLTERLKLWGVKYILDLDDDYKLPASHILYNSARNHNHTEQIIMSVKNAYAVTCTHDVLAAAIASEIGHDSVHIVPNGILPHDQFAPKLSNTEVPTLGWSGSITHFDDVFLVYDAMTALYSSSYKFKFVYGGYDPKDHTSSAIAGVLSAKGKAKPGQFELFPATDVYTYAKFYDNIDIALIPLRDNRFNNMKSNLKILEAGFRKKAVIVSDVFPYSPILRHGENCLVVKHKNDWYKHITKLIESPRLVQKLADNLYSDVQEFHMENVASTRYNIYKQLIWSLA